jgi:hypothetical protein
VAHFSFSPREARFLVPSRLFNWLICVVQVAARKAFNDTYLMMRDFHVEEVLVPSFEDLEDDDVLIDFVDQGALITVMGPGKPPPLSSIPELI